MPIMVGFQRRFASGEGTCYNRTGQGVHKKLVPLATQPVLRHRVGLTGRIDADAGARGRAYCV
jgi:hypothetical protein